MSDDVVRDAIAAELALLTRVTATPSAPFGYGSDLRCSNDLLETMDEVDGFSTLALGEAIARRLDCPRRALPDDASYGIDLRAFLNRGTHVDAIRSLAAQVRAEVEKDDRVERATVTVAPSPSGTSMRIDVRVKPADPRLGTFSMTLAVTEASVLLEAIR